MNIQRKAFEESNNVNPDWSFKFDDELQQYVAIDGEMGLQVDEFNEHWDTFRAGWQAAKAQAVPEWISTSERMPDEGEEVLVHSYGQVRQATRDSSWAGGFKERNCYGWQATHGQSHWMPKSIELPEQYHFYYENDAKQKAMIEAQEPAND